jgi:hypothetical protein
MAEAESDRPRRPCDTSMLSKQTESAPRFLSAQKGGSNGPPSFTNSPGILHVLSSAQKFPPKAAAESRALSLATSAEHPQFTKSSEVGSVLG